MRIAHFVLSILFFVLIAPVNAQQAILSKEAAVALALENNFGIIVAKNNVKIAANNKSILNTGFLPSLNANGGASYDINDQEATFQDGTSRTVVDAETTRYNASLNLNYTLFDGLGRWYDYKRLKETYELSELEARETIETTMLQLFTVYFEVARLSENIEVLEETFSNTKNRLQRACYNFEYGQTNKLDVLNAEVDLVNDSINLMNERQALQNAQRDLNLLLNRDLKEEFAVDTTLVFTDPLTLEEFLANGEQANVRILQAEKNIRINDYTLKSGKSVFLPTVGLTGSYGWNEGNFPATNFLASNNSTGFSAGVNVSWNLFDGGNGVTQIKNAKILLQSQETLQGQVRQEVKRDIANAKGDYGNRLEIYRLQTKNVATAANNYQRSNERYKLGQITSVALRQAQLNLLNARTSKNLAKYNAKLAELQLLQLTGQLLNTPL